MSQKIRLLPFVKMDYLRGTAATMGIQPVVSELVQRCHQHLQRQHQGVDLVLKNPVVFLDSFPGVEAEQNYSRIAGALKHQGCKVIAAPVRQRIEGDAVHHVDVVLSTAVIYHCLELAQEGPVWPLLFLGESRFAYLVKNLPAFDDLTPWVCGSASTVGSELREAVEGRIVMFEDLFPKSAQRTTATLKRTSLRGGLRD